MLAGLVLALLAPVLVRPNGYLYIPQAPYSDLTVTHWPNALFLRRALVEAGQLPFWRPTVMGGTPFLANPVSGLFYPPLWLPVLLPPALGFNLLALGHLLLAGLAAYALLRRGWRLGRMGALVGGLVYGASPKLLAHLGAGHVGWVGAWAWAPLVLLAVIRAAASHRRTAAVRAGALLGLVFLADLRLTVYLTIAALTLWVAEAVRRRADGSSRRWAHGLGIALFLLTAALLTAVQWLPLLAVLGETTRSGLTPAEAARFSLPPARLLGLLVAGSGGNHEWVIYLGLPTLPLAALGLWAGRRRGEKARWDWAVGMAAVGGLLALGSYTPLFPLLLRLVPGFSLLRVPARGWFLVVLGVALLAGWGADALASGEAARLPRRIRSGLNLAMVGFGGLTLFLAVGAGLVSGALPTNLLALAFLGPLTAGLLIVAWRPETRFPATPLLILLLVVDLWIMGHRLVEVRSEAQVFAAGAQAADWLAAQPGPFRVYSPSYSLPQHVVVRAGLSLADGVDPFQLTRYVRLMERAGGYGPSGYSVTIPPFPEGTEVTTAHRETVPDARLLGVLNVRYLAAAFPIRGEGLRAVGPPLDGVYLYENVWALPRAFVVGRVTSVDSLEEALAWLDDHDPAREAVVEGGPAREGPPGVRAATLLRFTPNRVVVEAVGPGLLVLADPWSAGWRATVGGEPVPVYPTDAALRGVYLPPGSHRVVFTYRPPGLFPGLALSLLALLLVAWSGGRVVGWSGGHVVAWSGGRLVAWSLFLAPCPLPLASRSSVLSPWSAVGGRRSATPSVPHPSVPHPSASPPPAPHPSEQRWLALWIIVALLLTSLPYLLGWALSGPDMVFDGFVFNIEDMHAYLSRMGQGARGAWLVRIAYTPEPHQGVLLFLFYVLLGKVAAGTGLSLVAVFHLARLICGALMLGVTYRFLAALTGSIAVRRLAFLLITFGGGLGWLLILAGRGEWLGSLPLDMLLPEGFAFLTLYALPHLAMARALLLLGWMGLLRAWEEKGTTARRWALGAGLAWMAMAWIVPFYLLVVASVVGTLLLLAWVRDRWGRGTSQERPPLLRWAGLAFLAGLAASPPILYALWVFTTNPVFRAWSRQNLVLSPHPAHYLAAYGPAVLLALAGVGHAWRRGDPRRLLPLAWLVVTPILVYLPFNNQRRLVEGFPVVLALLAGWGMARRVLPAWRRSRLVRQLSRWPRYTPRKLRRWGAAFLLLAMTPTYGLLLVANSLEVAARRPPIFRPADEMAAVAWLARHVEPDALVLAAYETGDLLPSRIPVRVFIGHRPETVDAEEKEALVARFFQAETPDGWRRDFLARWGIAYVFYGPAEQALGGFDPEGADYLALCFRQGAYRIYRVRPSAVGRRRSAVASPNPRLTSSWSTGSRRMRTPVAW